MRRAEMAGFGHEFAGIAPGYPWGDVLDVYSEDGCPDHDTCG